MDRATFIFGIYKIFTLLKSLVMYLVIKTDDIHFWVEQLFFRVFMLHERLSAGESTFSSVYTIVMKALIPSYPEVLNGANEDGFDSLYHAPIVVDEYEVGSFSDTAKQAIRLKLLQLFSNRLAVFSSESFQTIISNLRHSWQLFQKELHGQLELYKENFK